MKNSIFLLKIKFCLPENWQSFFEKIHKQSHAMHTEKIWKTILSVKTLREVTTSTAGLIRIGTQQTVIL